MESIKVLIADDHKIFRDGIKSLLENDSSIVVTDEAENGKEVLLKVSKNKPDVILMDIDMGKPNGIEITEKIKLEYPDVYVLILSMLGVNEYIIQALEKGATGYLLKNTGKDELLTAIKSVAKGDSYFSREVSNILVQHLNSSSGTKKSKDDIPLSQRETEVLKLIVQEYTNSEIAEELFISVRTIDTHKRNLLEKLQVKNTAGLVKYAIKKGLAEE